MRSARTFQVVHPVTPDESAYVFRKADAVLLKALRAGRNCNLYAGRLEGKTSMMLTCANALTREGHCCVEVLWSSYAFQPTVEEILSRFASAVVRAAVHQLGLKEPTGEFPSDASPVDTLTELFACLHSMARPGARIYVMVDEFDGILRLPHSAREQILLKLAELIQAYAGGDVVWLFITVKPIVEMLDPRRTAGMTTSFTELIFLEPIPKTRRTLFQLAEQAFPERTFEDVAPLLKRVLNLTGGQPHLVSRILRRLRSRGDELGDWLEELEEIKSEVVHKSRTEFDSHFLQIAKQLLATDLGAEFLVNSYLKVLEGEVVKPPGNRAMTELESLGLLRVVGGHYKVANPIFRKRLNRGWAAAILNEYQALRSIRGAQRLSRAVVHPGKKIAFLSVGGTLGMLTAESGSGFIGAREEIQSIVETEANRICDVDYVYFDELDGINVMSKDWIRLAEWIYSRRDLYHGIVVGHGTDTLAYSASAVAFILGAGLQLPIVFTGAQTTVSLSWGDAKTNLLRACYLASHERVSREVQVLFGDAVYRAVCVEKSDDRLFDGFRSPAWPELARVSEELLVKEYAMGGRPTQPVAIDTFKPYMADNIFPILFVPGLRLEQLAGLITIWENKPPEGVIVHTPGAGNIPYREASNFRDLVKWLVKRGVPVLVTSQVPVNPYTQPQYEMSRVVTEYGGILAGNITFSSAYTKFAWLIGMMRNECKEVSGNPEEYLNKIGQCWARNYVGEQPGFSALN